MKEGLTAITVRTALSSKAFDGSFAIDSGSLQIAAITKADAEVIYQMLRETEATAVVTNDHQPAAMGATVVAAATRECVNALNTIQAPKIDPRPVARTKTSARLLLKVGEAAEILGISPASIRRLIARGELSVNRTLRRVLIPRVELERFALGGDR